LVDQYDIAKLNFTAVGTETVATAAIFFDGDDVGLDTGVEDIKAFTLVQAGTSTTDKAAPVILSAVSTEGSDTLTVTFSEAVDTSNAGAGDLVTGDFAYVNNAGGGATDISSMGADADGTDNVVTLTVDANFVAGDFDTDTIATAAGQIYDLADNAASTAAVAITVDGNVVPTLTSFAAVIDVTNENTEVELTLAELKAQGDEADSDGTVDAFVVKSITSGTLKIGTSAGTATAWAESTNDTIDATNKAYWTADLDATGNQNAFEVVAKDDSGAESVGNVTAQVSVTPVPAITARETVDSDGDGMIDQIKITTDENLDDDFSGLTMTVDGYDVIDYSSDIANDNIFYVNLTESGSADTDATPNVTVTANTTLSEDGGSNNIAVEDPEFTTVTFTGSTDADTGIDPGTITYTHAVDFQGANASHTPATINGLAFTDGTDTAGQTDATTGKGFGLTDMTSEWESATGVYADNGTGLQELLKEFYSGSVGTLTLSDLTGGETYKVRFFVSDNSGNTVTFSDDNGFSDTVDRGGPDDTYADTIEFIYTLGAADTDIELTFSPGFPSFHWYGFTNEVCDADTTATDKAAAVIMSATAGEGSNELTVTFSEAVDTSNAGAGDLVTGDFGYVNNAGGGATDISSMGGDADGTDNVVTLTVDANFVAGDFNTDTIAAAAGQIYDLADNVASTAPVAIKSDLTPPTITAIETADLNSDGYIDAVHVTFSEAIDDSTVDAGDWGVAGVTLDAFVWNTNSDTANDSDIYLTFNDGVLDTGATPIVTYTQGTLTDLAGNLLATVAEPQMSIMLSTVADVTGGGAPGDDTWSDSEAFVVDDPNLDLGDTTNGTFAAAFDLDNFVDSGTTDIDAIHYVTQDITVGTGTSIDLQAGDIVLSATATETFDGTTYEDEDIFVFRPDTSDPYNSGTFFMLVDGSDIWGDSDVSAMTIIEQDTTIGGTVFDAGTLLVYYEDADDIQHLDLTSAGSESSGTVTQFIDVDDIDITNSEIDALELIETNTTIGGETLLSGELLFSILENDASVGTNSIAVDEWDIGKLNFTAVGADTVATAAIFFDGSDVGLDTGDEDIKAFTLVQAGTSTTDKAAPTKMIFNTLI